MKILAIETSCDETSVAVVEDGQRILSLVVNSQIDLHTVFGGVVPEVAARSHIEVMLPVVTQALEEAFGSGQVPVNRAQGADHSVNWSLSPVHLQQIDAIAVTQGPGLLGSLLIGVLTARTLAWTLNKPLIPVHHILGHIYANWIIEFGNPKSEALNSKPCDKLMAWQIRNPNAQNSKLGRSSRHSRAGGNPVPQLEHSEVNSLPTTNYQLLTKTPVFPVLALVVSGGHTQLMYATNHTDWRVIGRTQDDAVGEAFDKVAKVLGLPYPGGPAIARCAEGGDPTRYHLPTPKVDTVDPGLQDLRAQILELRGVDSKIQDLRSKISLNFSFSGLKTAVLRAVQKECGVRHDFPSFQLAERLSEAQKADFAASFQATAVDYLVSKTKAAFEEFQPKTVVIGGGVAASQPLRDALSATLPLEIQYAPPILCTDNAAMIGARAYFQAQTEDPVDPRRLEAKPSWPL